jgi:undecaprenyl-phosphate 4-deoxy-4-formamido-L-arabinose transferase
MVRGMSDVSQNGRPSLSVVIPVYNEEANLPELLPRTLAACRAIGCPFEIVFANDGSRDRSPALLAEAAAQHPEIVVVNLNRNYGQHNATFAGYAAAKGDLVVNIDADLQNPPEEIHKIYEKLCEGYDVVAGRRMARQDSPLRKIPSWLVNRMIRRSTGVDMHDYGCMLRGYTREVVQAMLACEERTPFIPVLANSFASRTCEVDVAHAERFAGESRYSFLRLVNLQFDMLTGMTTSPLRLLSTCGLAVFLLGAVLSAYIIVLRVRLGDAWSNDGVFTLFAILFFLVGAQFLGMGLLGEYIGRIFKNVGARPRYVVKQIIGESPLK